MMLYLLRESLQRYDASQVIEPETPPPAPPAVPSRASRLERYLELNGRSDVWQPSSLPVALSCELTTKFEGRPVMGTAVIQTHMPVDIPLELVPPAEVETAAPQILQTGGYFIFSDDYVEQNPESRIASLVREFAQLKTGMQMEEEAEELKLKKGIAEVGEVAEIPEDAEDFVPLPPTEPSPSAPARRPKKKKQNLIRDIVKEVRNIDRPLFRPQGASAIYGESKYQKRNFHAIMDEEYPLEYII